MKGKKVLITAGPTREAIDPVRFISNQSSGKMGHALALEFANRGLEVQLINGPTCSAPTHPLIQLTQVTSADEMHEACMKIFAKMDYMILCAAVADYKPAVVQNEKMKKNADELQLYLVKTPDILFSLGRAKQGNQLLIGFALETVNEMEYAVQKLRAKKADILVLNSLRDAGAGFGHDTNKIWILDKHNNKTAYELKTKAEVAYDIVHYIENFEKT